jgi:hypothetical protein
MANYYGMARTNYFKVKDRHLFEEWLAKVPDTTLIERGNMVGISMYESDNGCFPSFFFDDDHDEPTEFDIIAELSKHLAEGEVAILIEVGHEKARYACGWAAAVNDKGKKITINIGDIVNKAEKKFQKAPGTITDPTY